MLVWNASTAPLVYLSTCLPDVFTLFGFLYPLRPQTSTPGGREIISDGLAPKGVLVGVSRLIFLDCPLKLAVGIVNQEGGQVPSRSSLVVTRLIQSLRPSRFSA